MTEVWKCVDGTDGAIEISNIGRVRSQLRNGRILKTQSDHKGYLRVRVTINREKHTYRVHRLVANAFIPNPYGKEQVNHIDGDKTNNAASNLEWVTNKENAHHAIRTGLFDSVFNGALLSNEKRKRPIVAKSMETGETIRYGCIADAERAIGSRHITDVLKGKRPHAKHWVFSYEEVIT